MAEFPKIRFSDYTAGDQANRKSEHTNLSIAIITIAIFTFVLRSFSVRG